MPGTTLVLRTNIYRMRIFRSALIWILFRNECYVVVKVQMKILKYNPLSKNFLEGFFFFQYTITIEGAQIAHFFKFF